VTAPDSGRFVMCRVCHAAMTREHAAAHLAAHVEAGDLIRAASRLERDELAAQTEPEETT
jgi:hypothetical protein